MVGMQFSLLCERQISAIFAGVLLGEYLTIGEVCEKLRLADRTVYEMVRNGRLPGAAKVGGSWRIKREVLEAWLAAGGEAGAAKTGGRS